MDKTYLYRLPVDFNEPIRFDDLPHLIAYAMYPDEESLSYGVARLNLEGELEIAAQNKEIIVRNATSLGQSTLLVGEALKSSVVFADDVINFLGQRSIQLIDFGKTSDSQILKNQYKNKQTLQEEAIIKTLIENGFEPKNLPARKSGKSGPKAVVREVSLQNTNLFTKKTFNMAWERLRNSKDISGAN